MRRDRGSNGIAQRNGQEKESQDLRAKVPRQPKRKVENYAGIESRLCDPEQKAHPDIRGCSFDKGRSHGNNPPCHHQNRQPSPCADAPENEVGGDFEEAVTEKKDPGSKTVEALGDAKILVHGKRGKADVDPVKKRDHVEQHQEGDKPQCNLSIERALRGGNHNPAGSLMGSPITATALVLLMRPAGQNEMLRASRLVGVSRYLDWTVVRSRLLFDQSLRV